MENIKSSFTRRTWEGGYVTGDTIEYLVRGCPMESLICMLEDIFQLFYPDKYSYDERK